MRVDDLKIGEIYRISDDDRVRIAMSHVQYDDDKFIKFDYTTLQDSAEDIRWANVKVSLVAQLGLEPLVYIGTKQSRLYTHEPVEAAHVFASTTGDHFCILGRHIKYILPFTP